MLRSMADPFELNVTSLSGPIREKAIEQSPPALLFCIFTGGDGEENGI